MFNELNDFSHRSIRKLFKKSAIERLFLCRGPLHLWIWILILNFYFIFIYSIFFTYSYFSHKHLVFSSLDFISVYSDASIPMSLDNASFENVILHLPKWHNQLLKATAANSWTKTWQNRFFLLISLLQLNRILLSDSVLWFGLWFSIVDCERKSEYPEKIHQSGWKTCTVHTERPRNEIPNSRHFWIQTDHVALADNYKIFSLA